MPRAKPAPRRSENSHGGQEKSAQMKSRTNRRRGWLAILPILALGAVAPAQALGASDLSITKTDSADPAPEGAPLTYTITVSNAGPDASTGVQVVDELPSQVDPVSAAASQGTCDTKGKTVTCALGTLASGASATVTIQVTSKKAGLLSNTATVTSADTDSYMPNNSDTETTQIVAAGGGGGGGGATCAGQAVTIVGTGGADTLTGTDKRDVIKARGGNDNIRGLAANDVVCAGGGNDTVKGGGGNDRLKGGTGKDLLLGGGGSDDLAGGPGRDRCRGGAGQDTERGC